MHRRENGNRDYPRNEQSGEHRHADRDADQMSGTEERQRPRHAVSTCRGRTNLKHAAHFGRQHARRADNRQPRRRQGAEHHRRQSFTRFFCIRDTFATGARSHFEHLGGGHAFGIWQVRVGNQRASQGDREHHAKHTATHTDQKGLPERKAGPPTDNHEPGQHEDDG